MIRELLMGDMHRNAAVGNYDPGHDLAGTVTASLRGLTDVWMGELTWQAAVPRPARVG